MSVCMCQDIVESFRSAVSSGFKVQRDSNFKSEEQRKTIDTQFSTAFRGQLRLYFEVQNFTQYNFQTSAIENIIVKCQAWFRLQHSMGNGKEFEAKFRECHLLRHRLWRLSALDLVRLSNCQKRRKYHQSSNLGRHPTYLIVVMHGKQKRQMDGSIPAFPHLCLSIKTLATNPSAAFLLEMKYQDAFVVNFFPASMSKATHRLSVQQKSYAKTYSILWCI